MQTLPHMSHGKANCGWINKMLPPPYGTLGRKCTRPLCSCQASSADVTSELHSSTHHCHAQLKPLNSGNANSTDYAGHRSNSNSLARPQFTTSRLPTVPDLSSPSRSNSHSGTPLHFTYNQTAMET